MLLYSLPAVLTRFTRSLIIKGNANNGTIPLSFPFPALVTSFLDIAFNNDDATDCINEETIGVTNEVANSVIRVPCFFNSYFTV